MAKASWREIGRALLQKNMLVATVMGFASGVPLLLTSKTLQAWLSYGGASNVLVGVAASIALPYTFKFAWAPLLDRYELPFLGRRRGWLLVIQLCLLASIAALSRVDVVANLQTTFILAFVIAFFSATQDTLVDAFRRESLKDEELGLGSSLYQMGYRVAMWLTGGATLVLAGQLSWNTAYLIMAGLMVLAIAGTLWADEPEPAAAAPKTITQAVVEPLREFFSRQGALLFLLFILLYKVGDSMAGNMLAKFYVDLQFTPEQVGVIAKTMGPLSALAGTFFGGILVVRMGIQRALFVFGIFQALSTLSFAALHQIGHSLPGLTAVVFFEDFSAGMGSAAFMAFMASLTNRAFTATQYALLTSLMAVPRTIISSFTGFMVDGLGWSGFFIACTVAAVPGMVLLTYLSLHRNHTLPSATRPATSS